MDHLIEFLPESENIRDETLEKAILLKKTQAIIQWLNCYSPMG
jgi:hypothetical protein